MMENPSKSVCDRPPKYMLDSNTFDDVLDGKIVVGPRASKRMLITGVQESELRAIPEKYADRRTALLRTLRDLNPTLVHAASLVFDIEGAGFDQAYWNDGSGAFQKMLVRLEQLDGIKRVKNQLRDIVIAETAIKNEATLVTKDPELRHVVSEFGGRAINPEQFESETR